MHPVLATAVTLGHGNIFASPGFIWFLLGIITGFIIRGKWG